MQIIWRTLPRLALPAAVGLGLAYLATGFVPRPAPSLRPPEDLRAVGQGYAEESPVRTILERNVLKLESPLFYPLGQPPAPIAPPEPRPAPKPAAPAAAPPARAAFAPADTSVAPPAASLPGSPQVSASTPLSGGHSVQGQAVAPAGASVISNTAPNIAPGAAPLAAPAQPAPAAKAPASAVVPVNGPPAQQPRPAAAPVPAAPAQPGLGIEGFRLVGVIAGGERPLAMLQVDGASVSLRPGEQVRGWTLVTVEPGQVLLKSGERLRRLTLGGRQP